MKEPISTPTNEAGSLAALPDESDRWLLGSAPAGAADRRRAGVAAALLLLAFVVTAPFAGLPLLPIPSAIPAYDTAVIVLDLVTAVLLYAQYRQLGHRAFLALACGFLFTALLAGAHALSFPDAFVPGRLIGGEQTTAWLWMLWHGLFPFAIIAYARSMWARPLSPSPPASPERDDLATIAIPGTIVAAAALIAIGVEADRLLPPLMIGNAYRSTETTAILALGWLSHFAALLTLVWTTRFRRTLDLWLTITLLAGLIDLALSALLIDARYELGFYAGRFYGLLGSSFVLAVLLRRAIGLHAGLMRTTHALSASDARMRSLVVGIPQLVFRSRTDGSRIWVSRRWMDFTGLSYEQSLGFGWLEAIHPDDREGTLAAWQNGQDGGELYIEHRIRSAAEGDYCWHQTRALPLRDGDQPVNEWIGSSTDVDELRRLQRHQQTLFTELQHRVRNALAVVRSIARRTAEASHTIEDLDIHLQGRLDAFSRVQAVLTRNPETSVDLMSLIEDELRAHAAREGDSLTIDGPEIGLTARAAESISLAIHELATNAVKYGALSSANGNLSIGWQRSVDDGCEWLDFHWQESGLDQVLGDSGQRGFGFELLERSLPYDLRATTELELAPDGLRFIMRVPLGSDVLAS
jgi:PAS domain S-box-containing protein